MSRWTKTRPLLLSGLSGRTEQPLQPWHLPAPSRVLAFSVALFAKRAAPRVPAEDDLCKRRYQMQSGSNSSAISLQAKPSVVANKGSSQFCDVSASGLTFDRQPGDLEMTQLSSLSHHQTFRTLLIPHPWTDNEASDKSENRLTWQRHVNVFGLRKFFNSALKRLCVFTSPDVALITWTLGDKARWRGVAEEL